MIRDVEPASRVLWELYVARDQTPRRFHLGAETLRNVADRDRLTEEFVSELREYLGDIGILMSQDRGEREALYGFVSDELASKWPALSNDLLHQTIKHIRSPVAKRRSSGKQTEQERKIEESGRLAVERLCWFLGRRPDEGSQLTDLSDRCTFTRDQFAQLAGSRYRLEERFKSTLRWARSNLVIFYFPFPYPDPDRWAVIDERAVRAWHEPTADRITAAKKRALPRWSEEIDDKPANRS